jgi:hypothetical protein
MDPVHIAIRVLLAFVAFVAFILVLLALVRGARRGGKGMRAAGAMLMLFGWGNLRDPSNDTVAEAQDGRIRKGNESGDPLR